MSFIFSRKSKIPMATLATLIVFALAACGGGGSGSGGSGGGGGNSSSVTPLAVDSLGYVTRTVDSPALLELSVPQSWRLLGAGARRNGVVGAYLSPLRGSGDKFHDGIFVFQFTLDDLLDDPSNQDITILRERSLKFAGYDAHEILFNAKVKGESTRLKFLAYEVTLNDDIYVIAYVAEQSEFEYYEKVARHVLESVNIGVELQELPKSSSSAQHFAVATDGENFLTVYCHAEFSDNGDGYDTVQFRGVLSDSQGQVLREVPLNPEFSARQTGYECEDRRPSVTFGSDVFLVVFGVVNYPSAHLSGLYGVRVDRSGQLYDSEPFLLSTTYAHPHPQVTERNYTREKGHDTSFNGKEFLVAWRQHSADSGFDEHSGLFTAVVPQLDAPKKSQPVVFLSNSIGRDGTVPKVTFFDSQYFMVWAELRDVTDDTSGEIYGLRLSKSGEAIDAEPITLLSANPKVKELEIASSGRNMILGWNAARPHTESTTSYEIARFRSFEDLVDGKAHAEQLWGHSGGQTIPAVIVERNTGFELLYYKRNAGVFRRTLEDGSDQLSPEKLVARFKSFSEQRFSVSASGDVGFLVTKIRASVSGWFLADD